MANRLIYYKCMIPEFLKTTVIGVGTAGSDETELEIGQDAQDFEIVLQHPLINAGDLGRRADLTVNISVSAEGPPPVKYDPLAFCVTDGDKVMGVQLRDPSEYHTIGPYQGIFGDYGRILTNITELKSTEKEQNYRPGDWQRWPQMFNIKLKPNPPPASQGAMDMAPWGLCSSAANGGISLSFIYPRKLRVDDGLNLVLFRNKNTETYTINMIEVAIYQDGA